TSSDQALVAALRELKRELESWPVDIIVKKDQLVFATDHNQFILNIVGEKSALKEKEHLLPHDYLVRMPSKVAAFAIGKLGINKRIFARNCEVVQVKNS